MVGLTSRASGTSLGERPIGNGSNGCALRLPERPLLRWIVGGGTRSRTYLLEERMLGRIVAFVLLQVTVAPSPVLAEAEDVIIGILESLPPESAAELQRTYGSTAAAEVRVAF